jgi:lipoprotein-releasing system ATP-binding protein
MDTGYRVVLEAKNLHKTFRTNGGKIPILQGIDLSVKAGESVAICGRSGQGKTTLLHILGLLDSPCQGSISICGQKSSLWNRSHLRRFFMGFVFQAFHLLDDENALDNVLLPLKLARKSCHRHSANEKDAIELLDEMGLGKRLYTPTRLLSGGEKQRVALARALISRPTLILADEPSGNLDKETAELIHTLLIDGTKRRGAALIVVTHHEQLANLCSKRYVLQDGALLHN